MAEVNLTGETMQTRLAPLLWGVFHAALPAAGGGWGCASPFWLLSQGPDRYVIARPV